MTSVAVPPPAAPRRSTRPRLGAIVAVGVAFAILQTCLIATFPLLEGPELRSRAQSAVVSVLDFPLGFTQPDRDFAEPIDASLEQILHFRVASSKKTAFIPQPDGGMQKAPAVCRSTHGKIGVQAMS